MEILILLLRLIHIFSGVFWAGSIIMLTRFIQPAAVATAPESNKFMQRLMGGGLIASLTGAGGLTVLAGLILYTIDSRGFSSQWILTGTGLGFTVGALAGLAALAIGLFVSRASAVKLMELGKQIQTAGKPPTAEQMSNVKALQERLTQATLWTAIYLAIAVAAMATARYL